MTTFCLVRHGTKADQQRGDAVLNEQGMAQAQTTAQFLATCGVAAIYASPLQRTLQTAAPLKALTQLPIHTDARLRERMNWGDIPDQSFEEFIALWHYCSANRSFVAPTGASAERAGENFGAALQDIAQKQPDGVVVVVTHGGVLVDWLLNQFDETELHNRFERFPTTVPECSITRVRLTHNGWHVIAFAETDHLDAPVNVS